MTKSKGIINDLNHKNMKRLFYFFILLLFITSCKHFGESDNNTLTGVVPNDPPKILYEVKYGFGSGVYLDYSISEIEYLDGRIRYVSYNHNRPDTVIVGGSYHIERYKK